MRSYYFSVGPQILQTITVITVTPPICETQQKILVFSLALNDRLSLKE